MSGVSGASLEESGGFWRVLEGSGFSPLWRSEKFFCSRLEEIGHKLGSIGPIVWRFGSIIGSIGPIIGANRAQSGSVGGYFSQNMCLSAIVVDHGNEIPL